MCTLIFIKHLEILILYFTDLSCNYAIFLRDSELFTLIIKIILYKKINLFCTICMHMIINNYINYTSILAVRNTTKRMQSKSNTGPLRIDFTSSM